MQLIRIQRREIHESGIDSKCGLPLGYPPASFLLHSLVKMGKGAKALLVTHSTSIKQPID